MNNLYFDIINGISGDMTVAALLDLLNDDELFLKEIKKLNLSCEYEISSTEKNGIFAKTFTVKEKSKAHSHNHLSDILELLEKSPIAKRAKKRAAEAFTLLAMAEAKVHNTDIEKIHFHEVGAIDSISDIVGACILLELLNVSNIYFSTLTENSGFTHCEHGVLPVPVPAVVEILKEKNVSLRINSEPLGETITPTGAALICSLGKCVEKTPQMKSFKIGYGGGKKDFKKPNVLRAFLFEEDNTPNEIIEINANIDDMSGEALSFATQRLMKMGALDVFLTPIFMKKSRPAYLLTLLCKEEDKEKFCLAILKNTTTAGLRIKECSRVVMARQNVKVNTVFGEIDVKKLKFGNIEKCSPEYESVSNAADKYNEEFMKIYDEAKKA